MIFDGDSLSKCPNCSFGVNNWPDQAARQLTPRPEVVNLAVGGSYNGHGGFDLDWTQHHYPPEDRVYVLITGLNGLASEVADAEYGWSLIAAQIAAVQAAGITRIVLGTEMRADIVTPDTPDRESAYQELLALIRGGGFPVIEWALDASLQDQSGPGYTNPHWVARHPLPYGPASCETMASIAVAVLQAAINAG